MEHDMRDVQHQSLNPSLWRTCRVLANKQRLGILVDIIRRGPRCVSDIADASGLSESTASQYLRQLNARGLLRASRSGRFVSYSAQPDPDIYESVQLVAALRHAIDKDKTSTDRIFAHATAFTHWRRIQIVQCLAENEKTPTELVQQTGISREALHRHLKKLMARGYVLFDRQRGYYQRGGQTDILSKSLQNLVLNHPLDLTEVSRKKRKG